MMPALPNVAEPFLCEGGCVAPTSRFAMGSRHHQYLATTLMTAEAHV
jgi:hypothetical protein